MLDLKFLRDNLDLVREKTAQRKVDIDFDQLMRLDEQRRDIIQEVENANKSWAPDIPDTRARVKLYGTKRQRTLKDMYE